MYRCILERLQGLLADQVRSVLTKELGRLPTETEVLEYVLEHQPGLVNLTNQIIKDEPQSSEAKHV